MEGLGGVQTTAQRPKSARQVDRLSVLPWLSVIGALVIWEAYVAITHPSPFIFVGPRQVAAAVLHSPGLPHHVVVSLLEVSLGLVLALPVGVGCGFWMAQSRWVKALFGPWIAAIYATPIVVLVPVIIIWFGLGTLSKVVVVFLSAVFPILLNTIAGIEQVNRELVEMARAFLATKRDVFRHILLPSTLPYLITALRIAIGHSLVGVLAAELFGATAGLGFFMQLQVEQLRMDGVMLTVAILGFLGLFNMAGLGYLERRLSPWRAGAV